ncbi:MAG: hypothetical protein E6K30_07440 [Gammaproteobacteria bacterium]|nr:MAG: hypothetical protein E6K30_07440 [Gammaproteobacteria bacterium]
MSPTTRTVLFLIAVTALTRLALAALLGLSVDESYTVAIAEALGVADAANRGAGPGTSFALAPESITVSAARWSCNPRGDAERAVQ